MAVVDGMLGTCSSSMAGASTPLIEPCPPCRLGSDAEVNQLIGRAFREVGRPSAARSQLRGCILCMLGSL